MVPSREIVFVVLRVEGRVVGGEHSNGHVDVALFEDCCGLGGADRVDGRNDERGHHC